jgi:hypothetical protein
VTAWRGEEGHVSGRIELSWSKLPSIVDFLVVMWGQLSASGSLSSSLDETRYIDLADRARHSGEMLHLKGL